MLRVPFDYLNSSHARRAAAWLHYRNLEVFAQRNDAKNLHGFPLFRAISETNGQIVRYSDKNTYCSNVQLCLSLSIIAHRVSNTLQRANSVEVSCRYNVGNEGVKDLKISGENLQMRLLRLSRAFQDSISS